MAEMASLWGYDENHEMEQLGQKLLITTLELENIKEEARDQMVKNREYVKQLIQLLKFAIQERDEARIQLQKLLNKSSTFNNFPFAPLFHTESPVLKQNKANSSVTESDSLSTTYNYHSSPVDPFFDAVTSPEFSNMHLVGPKVDDGSLIIDNLAKGRVLPQKGKLLQAVIGAGPLLQTLLLAGPLPRWRNPPQLQPFQIPSVSIKGCETEFFAKQSPDAGNLQNRSFNSQTCAQMSCGPSSAPMLNFGNVSSANGLSIGCSGISGNGYASLNVKRQRFC